MAFYIIRLPFLIVEVSFFSLFLAPCGPLGLSLSAPSGILQQAFNEMRQERTERSSTLDRPAAKQEPGKVLSSEAALCPNSNDNLPLSESGVSTASGVSLSSTATSSPPSSSGRVSPPSIPTFSQTQANVTNDSTSTPQSSHETTPSQHLPAANIAQSSSAVSIPAGPASVLSASGTQLSTNSASSVVAITPSSTGGGAAAEPFNSAVVSSQPVHAPQLSTSQSQPVPISTQPPPPSSVPSQSQVQPQTVESEGAEVPTKTVGRDDIQALDKKLRSLFKDQSSASSSTSMDANQNTGTSSPPTGTTSPPPGAAMVPPSNLALNSGVQGVAGATTTPGQGITPAGHAQTPPSKPRAQVSGTCRCQE